MQTQYYTTPHGSLAYYTWGSGTQPVVCFHGYGETADSFLVVKPYLEKHCTVLTIEMPFHGATQWHSHHHPLHVQYLAAIITSQFGTQAFTVLGYSMGGRVALQLLQFMPKQIQKMVLLAPDGFHKNFWQRFATQTWLGNKVFEQVVKNPTPVYYVLQKLVNARVFNKSVYKFADTYLHISEVRQELYKRWLAMRLFKPSHSVLKKIITQHNTHITLVFGSYDRIITAKYGHRFAQKLNNSHVKIISWPDGHQLLKSKHAEAISKLIQANICY